MWGVRGRALSHPRLPALWAGCRGPLPTCCGCGGVRAWGPVTNPTARALACCGGGMRVPGGGASCLGVGRPGSGALPPPTARPLGGLPGPTTDLLWVRGGAGVGTRHQPHSARSCELALRAVGAARGCPGGRLLPGCGASGVGRSPNPDCPPSGRAAGAHYPLAVVAGGCGCGGPSPTPQRALLRAGFARCGGGTSAPGGGASCLGVGRRGSGALPPPTARPLGGLQGPTTHWLWLRGGAGVGARHRPHRARSCELVLRAVGTARGRPGGGASCLDVGRPGSGALPPPTARPLNGLPGPTTHWLWVQGGRAWGPVTNPTARALACCGGGMRMPGGGASCLGVGRPGSGALPPPTARPLGGLPGPTTHWLWVRGGCGRGDPSPTPQRALLRAGFARCGGGMRVPGGGASCLGVGRTGSGALPAPDCPPSGRAAGAHYPLAVSAGGCGRGDPSPTPQRALLRAGFARCGGGMRAPGGGASCLGLGRPGSGALPAPTARPLGGLPGPTTHWLWVRGGCGRGDPSPTPQRALLRAGFARCGGGMRVPGGGASCLGVGRTGSGALPAPDCPPSGRAAGAHYPLAVSAGGCGRGDPSPTPHCALLRAGFARCGGRTRAPGGGASCLGLGRPGSGALPPPTARPLGGLPGPTTHWLWLRGGAGVGTRHQPHSTRS